MSKKIYPALLFIFLLLRVGYAAAQNNILKDSTYLSLQKIKNDSARNSQIINYTVTLIMKKNPMGAALGDLLIKNAIQIKNNKLLAQVYGGIGGGYLRTGEYANAYPNFLKALTIYQKIDDPKRLIRVYQNMAWIQIQLKDDGANNSLQNALKIAKERNFIGIEAEIYSLYGVFYDSHLKFDKAITAYKEALLLNEKSGTKYAQISTLTNLAISLRRSKLYNESLENLLKAKTLAEQLNDKYLKQSVYQNLAELTLAMKDYDSAEKYILLALSNSKDNYEAVERQGLFENLKNVYSKKGEFKKALVYADSVISINDEVFAKQKVADIRNLQVKYETEIKDRKIEKQNSENLQQKQQLEINQKKTQIQQLNFANKQKQFETEGKLQASLLQKNNLQAKLDKQVRDAEIFKQNNQIKSGNRKLFALLVIVLFALIITPVIYLNQQKTKKLNTLILAQKQELENVNAVKDRMFSIVGHDMRSPINTLIAFNHLLENENISGDKLKLYSGEIKKTLDNTATMMNNLLNWANSQMQGYTPSFETHNLKDIAEQVVNSVTAQAAQKSIIINNHIPQDIAVYTDSNMTELILRNLVTNAIKFTPPNGIVTLNATQTATGALFSVSDSGIGMSPEQVIQFNAKKLDYTVKSTPGTNKEKGTGLGLLLCKTFTELMHGEISVKSEPGSGSTFSVTVKNVKS
jgi:signal transduction histidine kinase